MAANQEKHITIPAKQIYKLNTAPDEEPLIAFWYKGISKAGKLVKYMDININLSKAGRPQLDMLAAEVGVTGYRIMKKQDLATYLNYWIKFEIPESLKSDYDKVMTSILDVYYDVPQTYIHLSQQTKFSEGPVKFWLANDPNTRYSEYISQLTIKELRNICKHIGINNYSKWKRHELIELLEDKIILEEQGS